ncbi:hypothetical protein ACJX0J_013060 [Zea mays]
MYTKWEGLKFKEVIFIGATAICWAIRLFLEKHTSRDKDSYSENMFGLLLDLLHLFIWICHKLILLCLQVYKLVGLLLIFVYVVVLGYNMFIHGDNSHKGQRRLIIYNNMFLWRFHNAKKKKIILYVIWVHCQSYHKRYYFTSMKTKQDSTIFLPQQNINSHIFIIILWFF